MVGEEAESPTRAREQEVLYIVDVPATLVGHGLAVDLACRRRKANGDWGVVKPLRISGNPAASLPEPLDRQILALLAGARAGYGCSPGGYYGWTPSRYYLASPLEETLVPLIARTGRCRLRLSRAEQELSPIEWDDDLLGFALWLTGPKLRPKANPLVYFTARDPLSPPPELTALRIA